MSFDIFLLVRYLRNIQALMDGSDKEYSMKKFYITFHFER